MSDPSVLGIDESIISSLNRTFESISEELPQDLEIMLMTSPLVRGMIRKYVLLLSENIRDSGTGIPLCHKALAESIAEIFSAAGGDSSLFGQHPDRLVYALADCLATCTIRVCSVKIDFGNREWDLEKAFCEGDYLFSHLAAAGEILSVKNYRVREPEKLHMTIMRRLLTRPVYEELKRLYGSVKPRRHKIQEERPSDPVFQIVSP